jgi:Na+/H+ antiporter NhaA
MADADDSDTCSPACAAEGDSTAADPVEAHSAEVDRAEASAADTDASGIGVMDAGAADSGSGPSGLTAWSRGLAAQLSGFLGTEAGSSGVLIAAIVVALIWANVSPAGYEAVWSSPLSVSVAGTGISLQLRDWVSSGLMTLFFLVVGLEARREFDLGSLRRRIDFVLPAIAGAAGMALPIVIFLLVNHGGAGAQGWGIAMSSDTALALGLMTLVARGVPDRAKGFLLTLFIVDDLIALLVIAVGYSRGFAPVPFAIGVVAFAAYLLLRGRRLVVPVAWPCAVAAWVGVYFSGVDPLVVGLAIGVSTRAYVPSKDRLEEATTRFRRFREQPTFGLAREVRDGLRNALSRNERLESIFHPWSGYVIVPLFALANAGVSLDGPSLVRAYTSPIGIGVIVAYVIGKPVAVVGSTTVLRMVSRGRLRAPVGWASVTGIGTIAGVGFTVSLLIAGLAFHGADLAAAKIGVLTAVVASSVVTWAFFRVVALLPPARRARALLGESMRIVDLADEVVEGDDHIRGPHDAAVTVVEYGDFECPYCGLAEPSVLALTAESDLGIRFVWRHLPLTEVHPRAQQAAEAAEAAAAQGRFWEMHDLLLQNQERLERSDLVGYAARLGLDVDRFAAELHEGVHRARVARDVESADSGGVSGTPTFFINGRRHYGAYDVATLREAVLDAYQESLR